MNRVCTLQDLKAHEPSAQKDTQENAHSSGPGKTLVDTPESTSTVKKALGATPHLGQQNGSESNNTINNIAEKVYGAGTHNNFSGATFN